MFGWLKRKPSLPPVSAANPGKGARVRMGFANGERSWGEEANLLAKRRQIIFGPTVHRVTTEVRDACEQHDFCPCCLLTQSLAGFMQPLEGDEFCGIRLFASRDQDGLAQTDCRINGVDWPAGAEALLKYVATWPERGLENRKQFVAIRTLNPT